MIKERSIYHMEHRNKNEIINYNDEIVSYPDEQKFGKKIDKNKIYPRLLIGENIIIIPIIKIMNGNF